MRADWAYWMRGRGILLTGPGTHSVQLTSALKASGHLAYVVHYYPEWILERYDGAQRKVRLYRHLVWLMWAGWRRLPKLRYYETPKTWQAALYDYLARKHLFPQMRFLWAYSGMSLFTMQKARVMGVPVFLEFAASHPFYWNSITRSVYASLEGRLGRGKSALLPAGMVRRQLKELELADKVIVLSSFVRRQMVEAGLPGDKVVILPLGVDTQLFRPPTEGLRRRPFIFLYVGRIDPLKGVHHLLAAWKKLHLPEAELWLVGPVAEEMRPILAAYEGLYKYWGALPQARLAEVYTQATALVFPTLLDSFGLVLLEGMAAGLPVIATDHSGAPDVLEGLPEVRPIPAGSEEALKEAMERLYLCSDLTDLGLLMRQRVGERYTLDHYKQRVAEFLAYNLSNGQSSLPAGAP